MTLHILVHRNSQKSPELNGNNREDIDNVEVCDHIVLVKDPMIKS